MAKLSSFHGTWEVTNLTLEDQKCRGVVSWKPLWKGKHAFLEHRYAVVDPDEKLILSGLMMIGQDPVDHKIKFWGFESTGLCAMATLTKRTADHCVWESVELGSDGKKRQCTIVEITGRSLSYLKVL